MKLPSLIHAPTLALPARRKGFSIIELMVAMTIGLVLVAGLFYVYLGAAQSSRFQGALAAMQSNARFAFEIMGVDLRMTGFTGSQVTNPQNVVNVVLTGNLCPMVDAFGNKNCTAGGNPVAGPLVGYENTNPPNVCTTANTTPCYRAGTDSLTVVRVDTANKYTVTAHDAVAKTFTLASWPASDEPKPGEIFVAADYINAAVFQTGSTTTSPTVSYGAGGSPGNGVNPSLGTFGPSINALGLYRLSGVSYYVGRNPVGEPALYREKLGHDTGPPPALDTTAEELVQGVDDMEITYGVDATDPINNVEGYWTAAQVTAGTDGTSTMPAGTPRDYWRRVLSVRITLTLVSGQNEKVGTAGDKLLRKTFTNTIAIRNRI
ncbi:MAG: PilW family protein [Candidatus Contendobacter sp.]|nr:PilW family protein [Candidatus Contendobacter sp.]MDG4558112.1 PilW family protein [Candidatus Contendobacter sp.]